MTCNYTPFPRTHASGVLRAATGDTLERRHAQNELCRTYWLPVYAFARRRGYCREQASDLTQGFFSRFVANNSVAAFDPQRCRFRHWLKTCFRNYLANSWDHDNAIRRGGGSPHVPFDAESGERSYQDQLTHHRTPEALFDSCYTAVLLQRVTERLAQEHNDVAHEFEVLRGFITYEDERRHRDVARELSCSEGAVRTKIHRLRNRYTALLRAEVRKTVCHAADVDNELRSLLAALIAVSAPHRPRVASA